jgi:hypothetical protein
MIGRSAEPLKEISIETASGLQAGSSSGGKVENGTDPFHERGGEVAAREGLPILRLNCDFFRVLLVCT